MNERKLWSVAALPVCLGFLFSSIAGATVLSPGGSVTPGTGFTESGVVVGTASGTYDLVPMGGAGSALGSISETVYCATALVSGVCATGLDFLYQFSDTVTTDSVAGFSATGFQNFTTDVYDQTSASGFQTPSATNPAPTTVVSSSSGNAITFQFAPAMKGGYSDILDIRTNATTLASNIVTVQDNATENISGFLAPAPEPLWSGLFLAGVMGAGLFVARRHRTA